MRGRSTIYLGLGCLLAMTVRAAWVTQDFDWTMNLLALVGGLALMLGRRRP